MLSEIALDEKAFAQLVTKAKDALKQTLIKKRWHCHLFFIF